MRNVTAIFRREFAAYFLSPLAYLVVPAFLGLIGIFSLFFQDIFAAGVATMRTVLFWASVFQLLLIPAITMRLFAEENRTGSLELLVTMPIRHSQVVLGKYLAALGLITVALALTISYPITLGMLGDLDMGAVAGGYLGLFLLGAAFTAIGTAASAFTRNQIIAFLVALVLGMIPFAMGYALTRVPGDILPLVQYLSFEYHFDNMARGVIDSRDLVYYAGVIAFFLHLAVFALDRRRLS